MVAWKEVAFKTHDLWGKQGGNSTCQGKQTTVFIQSEKDEATPFVSHLSPSESGRKTLKFTFSAKM